MTNENTKLQQEALVGMGVAVAEATARFAGKYELYIKSLKKFAARTAEEGVMDLGAARAMEAEELRQYVHGLKGVTANLSINDAYKMLVEIEQSIKDGNTDFEKYEKLQNYLPETARNIHALLSADEPAAPATAKGSAADCKILLSELLNHLQMGKAHECERVVARLRSAAWEGMDASLLNGICLAVEGYDYARAMEMIENVR